MICIIVFINHIMIEILRAQIKLYLHLKTGKLNMKGRVVLMLLLAGRWRRRRIRGRSLAVRNQDLPSHPRTLPTNCLVTYSIR